MCCWLVVTSCVLFVVCGVSLCVVCWFVFCVCWLALEIIVWCVFGVRCTLFVVCRPLFNDCWLSYCVLLLLACVVDMYCCSVLLYDGWCCLCCDVCCVSFVV